MFVPDADSDGGPLAASREVTYTCQREHTTVLRFASDAPAPATWDCSTCGRASALVDSGHGPVGAEDARPAKAKRTHMDMVRERRTDAELQALLDERLQFVRQRRGLV
nr:RNA polymerase-binding protein RbpA [Cellulomonas hominis]